VIAQDAISSIKTFHAFGAQEKLVNKYDECLEEALCVRREMIKRVINFDQDFFDRPGGVQRFHFRRLRRTNQAKSEKSVFYMSL